MARRGLPLQHVLAFMNDANMTPGRGVAAGHLSSAFSSSKTMAALGSLTRAISALALERSREQ